MGARRFAPDAARFLQLDTFAGALDDLSLSFDPITANRYSLAAGNPVGYMEWDGHMPTLDGTAGAVRTPKAPRGQKGPAGGWEGSRGFRPYPNQGRYTGSAPVPYVAHYINGELVERYECPDPSCTLIDPEQHHEDVNRQVAAACGFFSGICEAVIGVSEGDVGKVAFGLGTAHPVLRAARRLAGPLRRAGKAVVDAVRSLARHGDEAADATRAGDEAFHWTVRQAVGSIERTGLRAGSYATPQRLSQMQAHIDLALSPNVARNAVLRIDLAGLRQAGYEIPQITQVGRKFGMPGGGYEMHFPYSIPPEFLKVVSP